MSMNLILKSSCGGCGSTVGLYGSTCKHLTLCVNCGKTMAEKRTICYECGAPITRLIREYNVRASSSNDKKYSIGRFASGIPNFKKSENKWLLEKEGLRGRQVTDTLREKFKNKPWLLEDETGQFQYHGHLEGTQIAIYYLLMLQGKEFVAIPAGSWYNFSKVAQYKQLTLEEAEERMKNRKKTVDWYQRWMMKAAHNGAAAFGEIGKFDDREGATGGGKGRKKTTGDEDEANVSDRGDNDEEASRKSRLGLNKRSGDDDDIGKGDDWEHEEIFTDDDEAVGLESEEREDLAPDIPAPPEIKLDDEDEDEEEREGGLSKSGNELKKLLGRSNGLTDSNAEDGDDDKVAPKKETPKEEPVDSNSPFKATTSAAGRGTPSTSKSSKGKRKISGEESKTPNGAALKKMITKNELKSVKGENASSSKSVPTPPSGPVTEDDLRAVLLQNIPVTAQDLCAKFKSRLKLKEAKDAFAAIYSKIAKRQKINGEVFVVLKER